MNGFSDDFVQCGNAVFGNLDPELAQRTGIDDAGQAANMVVTVKRRVARALSDAVAVTVPDPADVEDELVVLLRALEGGR